MPADISLFSPTQQASIMRRTVSQSTIPTSKSHITSPYPKTTEKDPKEQPASWGWFVYGDCTPPTENFPKSLSRSRPAKQQIQPHLQTGTNKQNTAILDRNISLSESILINCLTCCHTTFKQRILHWTGTHQKLEPPKKETDNNQEPEVSIILR